MDSQNTSENKADGDRSADSAMVMPTSVDLSIEIEKLKLEREWLAIERERLEADREDLELREKFGKDPYDLTFGLTAICVVASICLIFGGIIGFTSGLDVGRSQAPQMRKVAVSREFTGMIKSLYSYKPKVIEETEPPRWFPRKPEHPGEMLFLMR